LRAPAVERSPGRQSVGDPTGLAAAAARGIELGPVETVAGRVHTTWITDPDGNRVQIGQPG